MGCSKGRGSTSRVGDHVAIVTSTPGSRTMDPDEMPAVPFCPSNSTTGREAAAPCGTDLGPRRAIRHCAHCHNHGITDQVKDEEHSCLFEACECYKDALFS